MFLPHARSASELRRIYSYSMVLSEKAMAPHSGTLAWKIPWMEEPARRQSKGSHRVGHNWATSLSLFTFFFFLFDLVNKETLVAQSCPTLCDPMDCSLPGFSVHGIFQARVLEWVAISFSIIFHFHAWEAWWAAVYGVAQSRTWLKWLSLAAMVLSSFPGGLASKKSTCNVGDLDLNPGLGRCPGGRHSNYKILDWRIPMDRGAWQATVHGIAKSHTWLSD